MCAQVLLPAATTDEKSLLARLERLESGSRGTPVPQPAAPPRPPHSGSQNLSERASVTVAADRKTSKPAEPPTPVRAPAAAPSAPAPAPPSASAAADSLGKNWDAVVEAVRRESRVAWALVRNASVVSLEGGILTLRFPSQGEMKGFGVSGHDAVLKRVLSADFGLNVTGRQQRPLNALIPRERKIPEGSGDGDSGRMSLQAEMQRV
jgi:DNA polymerase-3 subunit gamma/tau